MSRVDMHELIMFRGQTAPFAYCRAFCFGVVVSETPIAGCLGVTINSDLEFQFRILCCSFSKATRQIWNGKSGFI